MANASADNLFHHRHHSEVKLAGYPGKVFALCCVSRYRHVLLLDADNMPLLLPAELFSLPEYLAKGNLFWGDFGVNPVGQAVYSAHGLKGPWEGPGQYRQAESGQILLDR